MDKKNYRNAAENYKEIRQNIRESVVLLVSLTVAALGLILVCALVSTPLWMLTAAPFFAGIIIYAVMLKRAKAKLSKVRREYFAAARQMADEIRSWREERLSLLSAEEKKKFMLSNTIRRYQKRAKEAQTAKESYEEDVFWFFLLFLFFLLIGCAVHNLLFYILIPIIGEGYNIIMALKYHNSMRRFKEKVADTRRRRQEIRRLQKKMAVAAR